MSSFPEWVWDLVDLAAALAGGAVEAEAEALGRLEAADRLLEVEETLLQSHLFLGYPAALEAFRRWRARGVAPPEAAREGSELWRRRGKEICRLVYADSYERLRKNVAALHPDLDRWMVIDGYGKVLGRPDLSLSVREMCIVAMLVVMGAGPQLRAHLMGALNAGVPADQIDELVRRAGGRAAPENAELAQELWSTVRAKV